MTTIDTPSKRKVVKAMADRAEARAIEVSRATIRAAKAVAKATAAMADRAEARAVAAREAATAAADKVVSAKTARGKVKERRNAPVQQ